VVVGGWGVWGEREHPSKCMDMVWTLRQLMMAG